MFSIDIHESNVDRLKLRICLVCICNWAHSIPAPNSPPQSKNNQQPVNTTTKNTDEARKNTESLYYDTPSRPESPFEKEVVVAIEAFGGEDRVKIQIKEDKVDI